MFARHARSLGPAPELVLLAAAIWFTAAIGSSLAGAVLRPGLAAPLARATAPAPLASSLQPALHVERLERLLGLAPAPAPEGSAGAPPATARCDDPGAPPVRAASGLALVGGVLADPPERSLASVADATARETYLLAVGERRAGLRLLEVRPVRRAGEVGENARELVAVICNDGRKEYVAAAAGDAPAPDAPPRSAPPGVIAPARAVGRDRYAIERSALYAALTNPTILSDARVVPALEGGVARGFEVLSIRPGSFLASLGLENGDVIRTVDGYELTTVERALELHGRLREASRVTLELERGGRTIHREYEIGGR